jgi:hypothetical protein
MRERLTHVHKLHACPPSARTHSVITCHTSQCEALLKDFSATWLRLRTLPPEGTRNRLVNLEGLSDEDLNTLEKQVKRLRKKHSGTETIPTILSRANHGDCPIKAKYFRAANFRRSDHAQCVAGARINNSKKGSPHMRLTNPNQRSGCNWIHFTLAPQCPYSILLLIL